MIKNKIAILGAMREEIEPILKKIENIKEVNYGKNIFYEGVYKNIDVVIAYSKIGKVFSSLTTTLLIEKFKCNKLIFSGVAGAINKNLKIGDVIIANKICQYDIDLTAFEHPYGYIPESKIFIETDKKILTRIKNNLNAKVQFGIIATGDKFINLSKEKNWIYETFKADALDMESGSVAVVCDSLNVPFIIIRAISDNSEGDANIDFDNFLKTSAKKSSNLIFDIINLF